MSLRAAFGPSAPRLCSQFPRRPSPCSSLSRSRSPSLLSPQSGKQPSRFPNAVNPASCPAVALCTSVSRRFYWGAAAAGPHSSSRTNSFITPPSRSLCSSSVKLFSSTDARKSPTAERSALVSGPLGFPSVDIVGIALSSRGGVFVVFARRHSPLSRGFRKRASPHLCKRSQLDKRRKQADGFAPFAFASKTQIAGHLQESSDNMSYTVRKVGQPNTLEHRIYIERDGVPISPFHDIPLFANEVR